MRELRTLVEEFGVSQVSVRNRRSSELSVMKSCRISGLSYSEETTDTERVLRCAKESGMKRSGPGLG